MRVLHPTVYIMTNRKNGTLYVGVTSNLPKRVWQHRVHELPGFTSRYGCHMLVWYEEAPTMEAAILREKHVKAGSRAKKKALVESMNPLWQDLYPKLSV